MNNVSTKPDITRQEYYALKNGRYQKYLTLTTVANLVFENKQQNPEQIQTWLNDHGIPLNCVTTPRQTERNYIHQDVVNEFLEYVKTMHPNRYQEFKDLWEKWVKKITLEELDDNLKKCTAYFMSLIKENPYEVGFIPKKSSKWIAELALLNAQQLPLGHFTHATDTDTYNREEQTPVSPTIEKFVIFDDVSYTAMQLVRIVGGFIAQLIKQNKKAKLYLVVPFIANTAKTYFVNCMREYFQSPLGSAAFSSERILKIHLITSNVAVITLKDFLPKSDSPQGITFTEWKIPDGTSLSSRVTNGEIPSPNGETKRLSFLTNFRPCYKAN